MRCELETSSRMDPENFIELNKSKKCVCFEYPVEGKAPFKFEVSLQAVRNEEMVAMRVATICFIQVRDGRSSAADVCKLRDRMLQKRCKTGEDVAPASEAWDHCRVQLSQPSPLVSFQVDLKGGKKLPFQTTVGAAGG